MTIEEAKISYYAELPVLYEGIEYARISALIYRKPQGEAPFVQLELCDKCGRSVTIAAPDRCEHISHENEQIERMFKEVIKSDTEGA